MAKKKKKKVIVTGGCGYIGSHTVVELYRLGYEPVIFDNLCNSYHSVALNGIEKIVGERPRLHIIDCCDHRAVSNAFRSEEQIYAVIHFAAYKSVPESMNHPLKYYINNVGSLATMLNVAEMKLVKKFIFSSSCTVYGQPDNTMVTEQTQLAPASPYGNTKQICEQIIKDTVAANKSLSAVSLRYFNPIGAHPTGNLGEFSTNEESNNLIPHIMRAAYNNDTFIIHGNDYPTKDGTCVRDYVHVKDVAIAHVDALNYLDENNRGIRFDCFNLGTGKGTSVLELVNEFVSETKQSFKWQFGPRRPGDVAEIYADVEKAAKVLGWKACFNNREALAHAWKWKNNHNKLF